MLKVRADSSNCVTVETDKYIVLVSYTTPVAYIDKESNLAYKTDVRYRHVNRFLKDRGYDPGFVTEVMQSQVDNILEKE